MADDLNQPKHNKTKSKQCKTIGNHKITEDRARADDYNQPQTLQNHKKTIRTQEEIIRYPKIGRGPTIKINQKT